MFAGLSKYRNEHIENRTLNLQYTYRSAYPAGCAMLLYITPTVEYLDFSSKSSISILSQYKLFKNILIIQNYF
jgi:hypothetical protein